MKNVKKIYVCSPYTALKEIGDGVVRYFAISALQRANIFYRDERVEFLSPVLINMYPCEKMSHDEAMKICFDQLKSCNELFIGGEPHMLFTSKGVFMEYEYAKRNNIPISFEDEKFKTFLEKGGIPCKSLKPKFHI